MTHHGIPVIGALLYLAGLAYAESLRLPHRLSRLRAPRSHKPKMATRLASEPMVVIATLVGVWVLPVAYTFTSMLDRFDYALPAWTLFPAATVLAISLLLRRKAQTALGPNWSCTVETSEEHVLVTGGVYAHMRHPLYASLVLWAAAQPLLLQNLLAGFAGAMAALLIWLIRVPREERMMLERFGDRYRQYMARTGRLLPRRRKDKEVT